MDVLKKRERREREREPERKKRNKVEDNSENVRMTKWVRKQSTGKSAENQIKALERAYIHVISIE